MPITDTSARDLIDALDQINLLLASTTPIEIGQLAALRVRVMRSLIGYLAKLDERSSRLRLSANEGEKALSQTIHKDVQELRTQVNSHVAHWTPNEVLADSSGYRTASNSLQQAMRKVVKAHS